jgi:hypothetical protein
MVSSKKKSAAGSASVNTSGESAVAAIPVTGDSEPRLQIMIESQSAIVAAFLEKLVGMESEIPGFRYPITPADMQRLISNASVDDRYLETIAVMLDRSAELRSAAGIEGDALRGTVRFDTAYNVIPDRFEAFARGVRFTLLLRRDAAGKEARAVFELAKALARKPSGAVLAPYVAEIKKLTKRESPRKESAKRVSAQAKAGE